MSNAPMGQANNYPGQKFVRLTTIIRHKNKIYLSEF